MFLLSIVYFTATARAVDTEFNFADFNAVITGTAISAKVVIADGDCDNNADEIVTSFYLDSFDASYTGTTYFTTIATDYPGYFDEAELPTYTNLCFWYFTSSWNTDSATPFQYQPATPEPTAPASSSESTLVTTTSMFASSFLFMFSFLGIISYFTWRKRSSL